MHNYSDCSNSRPLPLLPETHQQQCPIDKLIRQVNVIEPYKRIRRKLIKML